LRFKTYGIYSDHVWHRIIKIARDHSHDSIDTLITYFPSDEIAPYNMYSTIPRSHHTYPVTMNYRILRCIWNNMAKDVSIASRMSSYYYAAPIIIAYLQSLWIPDPE
jgi:hypothetical protein